MTDIKSWSATAASNNAASPNGFPEGMAPSGVNDSAREVMAAVRRWYEDAQWIDFGHTPTQMGASTFTVSGDLTAVYGAGRRIKCADISTLYGTISASSYSNPSTTVTVTLDSGSLSGSLSAVAVSLLTPSNAAIPIIPIASGGTGATSAAAALANLGGVASSRAINAGSGLSGGGDLTSDRTLALGISGLTADSSPDLEADYVATYDADAGANKKVLLNDLLTAPVLHIREQQASGSSSADTFSAGSSITRTLNAEVANAIAGASLSSNQFELPAGTYDIFVRAPGEGGSAGNTHKAVLRNVSDSANTLIGSTASVAANTQGDSVILGRFTIGASKTFQISHYSRFSRGGGGTSYTDGLMEIYTEVMIHKVG